MSTSKYQVTAEEVQFAAMNPNHPRARAAHARMRAQRVHQAHGAFAKQVADLEAATAAMAPTAEEVQTEGFHSGRSLDKTHPDHATVRKVRAWRDNERKLETMRQQLAGQVERLPNVDSDIERADRELAEFTAAEAERQKQLAAAEESARRFPNANHR
jgi:hypothetical protein